MFLTPRTGRPLGPETCGPWIAGRDRGRRRTTASHPTRPGGTTFSMEDFSMRTAMSRVRNFLTSEDGPTAVEYAVMLALILVACITIVTSLGTTVSGTFSTVES